MMVVYQPRQDHMVSRLEERGRCLGLAALRHQFDNPAVLNDDAALGAIGEDGQRILDPDRPISVHNVTFSRRSELQKRTATPSLQFKDQPDPCESWRRSCRNS